MPSESISIEKHYDEAIHALKELLEEKEKFYLEKFDMVYTIIAHDKASIEEARKLALDALNKHLESLNSAAKTLADFKETHVEKLAYQPRMESAEEKARDLKVIVDKLLEDNRNDKEARKTRDNRLYTWLAGLTASILIFLLNYFFGGQ